MDEFFIALLIAFFSCLGGVICGYLAFFGLNRTQRQVSELELQLAQLQQQVRSLQGSTQVSTSNSAQSLEPLTPSKQHEPTLAQPTPTSSQSTPASIPPPSERIDRLALADPALDRVQHVIEFFKAYWMVLCGGLSLALAGLFLVRYSIDAGLLTPALRVGAAVVFACVLIALGSRLKNRSDQTQVHAACAGAGCIILYGSVLASGSLYGWLPSWGMFAGLVLISLLSMGLSLRHGPILAALGILGAFVVPIFVSTGQSSITGALGYALIVAGSGFALLRYVYRNWLWWGVWGLALMWLGVSLARPDEAQGLRSLYLLALVYIGFALPLLGWRWQRLSATAQTLFAQRYGQSQLTILWLVFALFQWAILAFETPSWTLYLGAIGFSGLALWLSCNSGLGAYFWLRGLALLGIAPIALELIQHYEAWGQLPTDLTPSYVLMAVCVSGLAIVLAGGVGWQYGSGSRMALACFIPLLMMLAVDLRLAGRIGGYVPLWLPILLLVALACALWRWRQRSEPDPQVTIVLLFALQAALSLSLIYAFEQLRLTLALAMQWLSIVALAPYLPRNLITLRFKFAEQPRQYAIDPMTLLVRVLLLIVIIRLALNPYLLRYDASDVSYLITYLGCALCGVICVLWLHRFQPQTNLRLSFEAGSVQLCAMAVAALTRYWLYDGQLFIKQFSWLESGIYVTTLLAGALAYQHRAQRHHLLWAKRCYYGLSLIQGAVALGLYGAFALLQNPNWQLQALSSTPLFNELLLLYGAPALLLSLIAWRHYIATVIAEDHVTNARRGSWCYGLAGGAVAMVLLFVILQIRHLWHGGIWPGMPMLDGEQYSYSVLGLLLGIGLTLSALRWRSSKLHQLASATLLLVIGKIFIWDLAGLAGLWRIASFFGLGVTLLGLAYGYNRLKVALSSPSNDLNKEEV